ncbi:ribosomal protein S18-alanine N-acetyltransferase [Cellulomonas endophytica]|uniref:ribosomal protein S18-alanine N-acetyltransferase n=1 Tax=Cellulomonas endophytica TaxID=2494735 RepID=UPI001F0CACD2|nr:ribosomal protein S18-alanine N-acetyltransferase [Cellulomonas endophytica]
MSEQVTVLRPLVPADLDRVMELEADLFGATAWSRTSMAAELVTEGREYLAAVDLDGAAGGLVVGYAGLWFDGDDAQVMTIATARTHQNRGVGRRLLTALVERSAVLGAQTLLLEVRVDNLPAQHLYASLGFERLGVRRNYYPGGIDAYTMRLRPVRAADVPAGRS